MKTEIPACLLDWEGTKVERTETIDYILQDIYCKYFSDMSRRNFNRLFLEAFARNLVQSELREMMAYIVEEEGTA